MAVGGAESGVTVMVVPSEPLTPVATANFVSLLNAPKAALIVSLPVSRVKPDVSWVQVLPTNW